tara:strand:- start:2476 stop:3099 length:624 start_codon:yes stop_codon:yes gene_type:complete
MTIKFVTPKGEISVISGKCIALIGDDIDTDRIIPARFLKCVDFEALGKSVFEDDRKDLKGNHPFDLEYYQDANILIVNSNFGCGSSREHAPQALMRWGIRAIIGESFAEIFYSNCVAIGIPCFTVNKEISKEIQSKAEKGNLFFEINLNNSSATQETLIYNLNIKESSKKMFLTGEWDATSTLLNNSNLIEKKMNELPYIQLNRNYS